MMGNDKNYRRGSIYIATLSVAMIVSIIGIAALTAVRVQRRTVNNNVDAVKARFYAQSAVELGLYRMANNPNWRNSYNNDTWLPKAPIDDGAYTLKLVDELDSNLANDSTQPVRLYAKATVGEAVRICSVQLQRTGVGGSEVFEKRVASLNDDIEQNINTGWIYPASTDLELALDLDPPSDPSVHTHMVGIRFTEVPIPQGAAVSNCYIQFTADEVSSGAASLTIVGENTDYASAFTTSLYNISFRTPTSAAVAWSPAEWYTVGEAGEDQRTPDISPIIQEIVDRTGWLSGNALVIVVSGSGTRTAVSYNGNPDSAPLLHLEWGGGGTMSPVAGTWRRDILW
ncbi:MAG: hypothetical protein JSV03_17775 [Planctomycetota bacterium]|nr:MAG: hypothetical protein JSV03_17775 [Planctomycetota bacterium]